ncbi:MAG: response regulator [Acidobacteria bacterium]|nr:response regulator [Acidobacteriota bacterium]
MKKVLVVEDDDHLREVVCQLIRTSGLAVSGAADGAEGLEKLEREAYDLVVLDVWMPRMNGLEMLSRLRAHPAPPKVLMLTADDTPETLLEAVREQAYQYLTKPFEAEALLDAVQKALTAPAEPGPIEVVSARPTWVELVVPCHQGIADRVQEFLERLKADLPEEVRSRVGHVFRELLLNAIEWGGEFDPNRKVRIAYVRGRRMLLYRIADPGRGFRFDDLDHAAVSHPSDQPLEHLRVREEKGLRPGGFGLLLAQAMADEMIYNEAQNEVVLVKYLA